MVMKHFERLSDWIDIKKLDKETQDFKKDIFYFKDKLYHICDFTKIHNNPWFGSDSGYPQFITGVERNPSEVALFIEISESSNQVRIYKEAKD